MILTSWHSGSSLLGSGGELNVLANSFLHNILSLVFKKNREVGNSNPDNKHVNWNIPVVLSEELRACMLIETLYTTT